MIAIVFKPHWWIVSDAGWNNGRCIVQRATRQIPPRTFHTREEARTWLYENVGKRPDGACPVEGLPEHFKTIEI